MRPPMASIVFRACGSPRPSPRQITQAEEAMLWLRWLEPEDGLELARFLNEVLAGMLEQEPERFYALGSVPLQDVDLAADEVRRIKSLGLHGVEEACAGLGVPGSAARPRDP